MENFSDLEIQSIFLCVKLISKNISDRKKGRGTERDKKKKALAERRKPLNIDHLDIEKLKVKSKELMDYLKKLEGERLDFILN